MARYDYDLFGSSTYGPGTIVPFLVDPVSGASLPQGPMGLQVQAISNYSIDVFWGSPPLSTSTANLTMVRLVRSEVGPPSWEEDGVVLVDAPIGNLLRYTDMGLRAATFYYYTIFVFDSTVQTWLPAGSADCITPDDSFDMGAILYGHVPQFYHDLDDSQQAIGAGPLQRFLALMGFEMDVIRTEIESLAWAWDMQRGSAQGVPFALAQYLLEPDPQLGYGNQKQLLQSAALLYGTKGSAQCVQMLCQGVTGWATYIGVGANLLVDNLDAQFDGSVGNWVATNATALWRAGDGTINSPNGQGMAVLTATSTSQPSMSLYSNDPIYSGVPVTAGLVYAASALVRGSAGDAVTLGVQFWDKNGNALGSMVFGTAATPDASDWNKQISVVATAPANAWSMSVRASTAGTVSGHITYLSSFMVQQLATTGTTLLAYQPARDIRVIVVADQINEVSNPKFAIDTNSWATTVHAAVTASGATLSRITSDEPPPVSSGSCASLVATASGQGAWTACLEVSSDDYYTATCWIKAVSGAGARLVVTDVGTGQVLASTVVAANTWTDAEIPFVTGETTTEVDISVVAAGATTVHFGAVMLTRGGPDVAYFDGDIASSTADYVWEGQANASRSHFYRQRIVRSYRFRELLPRFIVGGQTATLLFAQPPVT